MHYAIIEACRMPVQGRLSLSCAAVRLPLSCAAAIDNGLLLPRNAVRCFTLRTAIHIAQNSKLTVRASEHGDRSPSKNESHRWSRACARPRETRYVDADAMCDSYGIQTRQELRSDHNHVKREASVSFARWSWLDAGGVLTLRGPRQRPRRASPPWEQWKRPRAGDPMGKADIAFKKS